MAESVFYSETIDLHREHTDPPYRVPLVTFQHAAAHLEEIKNVITVLAKTHHYWAEHANR